METYYKIEDQALNIGVHFMSKIELPKISHQNFREILRNLKGSMMLAIGLGEHLDEVGAHFAKGRSHVKE